MDLGKLSVLYSVPLRPELRDLSGPTLRGLRAEDAPVESYLVQKCLVIWLQQITKLSVKDVNLETIIDLQSWCRTWPPNGSSRIRAKTKLHKKHKGACKSSWSQIGSLKSCTLTILWNLAKPVKIFPDSWYVDTTQIGNKWERWESSAQSKRRHLCCIVAIRSEWKLVGSFHGMCYLTAKYSRKTTSERRFEEPLKGPTIPFGSLVESYPISVKDKSRIHQFGKKVLPGLFLGYALYAGGIWKGDIMVADIEARERTPCTTHPCSPSTIWFGTPRLVSWR